MVSWLLTLGVFGAGFFFLQTVWMILRESGPLLGKFAAGAFAIILASLSYVTFTDPLVQHFWFGG